MDDASPKKVVSTEWKVAKVRHQMRVTSLSIPYLLASQSPSNLPWPPQVLFLQRICLRWQVGMRAPRKQFNFALCYTRAGPRLCKSLISPRSTAQFLKNTKQIIGFTAQYELASQWDISNIISNTWLHLGCAPKNLRKVITAKGC